MTIQLNITNPQDAELILSLVRRLNIQFVQSGNFSKKKLSEPKIHHPEKETDHPRLDMAAAAVLLADEYLHNEELSAFTVLDSEDFYEYEQV